MNKIAAMTPCWNEQSTIGFTVASLLPFVDYYVVVDSGSTDGTIRLLKEMFYKEIRDGHLHIIEYGRPPNWDISLPKNAAIRSILEADYEYFIRLDADDVFMGDGEARQAVQYASSLCGSGMTHASFNQWELYQYKFHSLADWLGAISFDLEGHIDRFNPNFMCMRIPPPPNGRFNGSYGHARIYKTDGAISRGRWTDEAQGRPGEDISSCFGSNGTGRPDELLAHYGWARPMYKKLEKNEIWVGKEKILKDPRMNKTHLEWKVENVYNIDRIAYGHDYWPNNIVFPFNKHPKAVKDNIDVVREILCE